MVHSFVQAAWPAAAERGAVQPPDGDGAQQDRRREGGHARGPRFPTFILGDCLTRLRWTRIYEK
jgi:hypothetical protein